MVLLLITEFLRVLIDEHSLNFYDAASIVTGMITYKARKDRADHYQRNTSITFFRQKMPRHFLIMHAINNMAVKHWVKNNTQMVGDLKLDNMTPNF